MSKRKLENESNKNNELLKEAGKKLEYAKGSKSEYWFGYCRAIYDLFPELEKRKKSLKKNEKEK